MNKTENNNLIIKLYQKKQTVFSFKELRLIFSDKKTENLKSQINYYVKKGLLENPRRGIYVKPEFNIFELATKIYSPSYISLETVLEKTGVIFQAYKTIFVVSYLNRKINIGKTEIKYHRIKEKILLNKEGLIDKETYFEAEKERAFLDILYLFNNYHFDNLAALNQERVFELIKIYQSKTLENKVRKILNYV